MESIIFVLLVVTIIGNTEPIFTFKPSIAFDTLERCEERLMNDWSEGDRISNYEYSSQNRRMVSSQSRFKKTFATCVETGVPLPLMSEIGNSGAPMPLPEQPRPEIEAKPILSPPRSRPVHLVIAAALEAALNASDPERDEAAPLAEQFIRGMKLAIAECWNLGALSSAALSTIVDVEMELTRDGKPVANSIKMLGFEGGDDVSAKRAFENAKRAILNCGAQGFKLPKEQFETWRRVKITFNPEKMRVR